MWNILHSLIYNNIKKHFDIGLIVLNGCTLCILTVWSHRHMIQGSCISYLPIQVQEILQKLSRTYTSSSGRHWGKGQTNSWNKILKEKGGKDKLGKLYADTKVDILQMYLSKQTLYTRTIGIYNALGRFGRLSNHLHGH